MNPSYLAFEQPIADLQAKIEELNSATDDVDIDMAGSFQSLIPGRYRRWQGIQTDRLRKTTLKQYLLNSKRCTVTVRLPMTRLLSQALAG